MRQFAALFRVLRQAGHTDEQLVSVLDVLKFARPVFGSHAADP